MAIGSLLLIPDKGKVEAHYLKFYSKQCGPSNKKAIHGPRQTGAKASVEGAETSTTNKGYECSESVKSPDLPIVVKHYQHKGRFRKYISKSNVVITLCTGQSLQCGLGPSEKEPSPSGCCGRELDLSFKDVTRWELAVRAIERINEIEDLVLFRCDEQGRIEECPGFSLHNSNLVLKYGETEAASLWDVMDIVDGRIDFAPSLVLPMLYGGIHLTAWNYTFPSTVEHILWKISGIGIMAVSPFIMSLTGVMAYPDTETQPLKTLLYTLVVVSGLTSVSYVGFRTFIVLEAFLSLRHSTLGVYAAIPWVQNLPHL